MVEQGHDKRNVVNSLLGLAQVHVVQEDFEVAAKLFGGFEMLLSQINSQFGTIQRLQLEKLARSLENSPNKNEMEKLKECGSSMPLGLLIELALKGTISTEKPQN